MSLDLSFFLTGISLGVGLAMDAFSVSLANGLGEPCMSRKKQFGVAGIFAFFQFIMPLIGWICVSTVAHHFFSFQKCVPWIALVLLCYIGIKMIYDGIKKKGECICCRTVGLSALLLQGVATSIDALSVGFTISEHNAYEALVACLMIGAVTFAICFAGITIGKKAGTRLAGKAGILGGVILVIIGLEIFITGLF